MMFSLILLLLGITLPKTNMAPENRPSQKETSLPTIHFQVRAVSFGKGNALLPAKASLEGFMDVYGFDLEKDYTIQTMCFSSHQPDPTILMLQSRP